MASAPPPNFYVVVQLLVLLTQCIKTFNARQDCTLTMLQPRSVSLVCLVKTIVKTHRWQIALLGHTATPALQAIEKPALRVLICKFQSSKEALLPRVCCRTIATKEELTWPMSTILLTPSGFQHMITPPVLIVIQLP